MLRQSVSHTLKNHRILSSSLKQPASLSNKTSTCFNSTRQYQQEASRIGKTSTSPSNPISSFFNRLFNNPKGFDKFFKDRKFNGQKGTPNNSNPSGNSNNNNNLNKNSLVSLLISSILLGAATFYIEDQLDNR